MNIKCERIYLLPDSGPIKAFADLSIDEVLLIRGIRIIEGSKGLFVSMPQQQQKHRWSDITRFLDRSFQKKCHDTILAAYAKALRKESVSV